jgi:polyhydroxybutyrate depolymerase
MSVAHSAAFRTRWLFALVSLSLATLDAGATCPSQPIAACRSAGRAKLRLDDMADDTKDRVTFSYARGPATTRAEFGSPTTATTVSLCLWDATGSLLTLDAPPASQCSGKPCWTPLTDVGFVYRDPKHLNAGLSSISLQGNPNTKTTIKVDARGSALPTLPHSPTAPFTVQLLRDDGAVCFEAVFPIDHVTTKSPGRTRGRAMPDDAIPALASEGCGQALALYTPGSSVSDELVHDGLIRTFEVYVPPSYDPAHPMPVVLNFHGGFGSGAQQESFSKIVDVATAEGFIAVSPDGVPDPTFGIRTWNGGGCCGYAVAAQSDDVGFVRALVDRLEANACIDRRRVYAQGMSNGAILSHRLACELADRIRAIGPVAGTNMTTSCSPTRPVPVRHVHGSADAFVPYDGGSGCGPGGVSYPSVSSTMGGWRLRGGCTDDTLTTLIQGDGTCTGFKKCAGGLDVERCVVANGGHNWPGGAPPALPGIGSCSFGQQSQTFLATRALWEFFAAHPPR